MRITLSALVFTLVLRTAVASAMPTPLSVADVFRSAENITAAAYPDADAVLVDSRSIETYQADGTSVRWDEDYVKILTEKGRREHSVITTYFTLPFGTADVVRVDLIRPSGAVVPVDIAPLKRVMVNPEQISDNIYNPNSKMMQVGVPNLQIGDIRRTIRRYDLVKPRFKDTWGAYEIFEYTSPIRRHVYIVNAPAGLPLRHKALRAERQGTVLYTSREEGDRVIHEWTLRNVPQAFEEPSMPPLHTVVQRLLLSTIPDWEWISTWYWNLSKPSLDTMTDEMRAKVAELIEGVEDRDAQIMLLFQYVAQNIRYMGLTLEDVAPGFEPAPVKTTFENRFGVCRDKTALLVAFLREAKFEAFPVLIHYGARMDEGVPLPYFNHAIVGIDDGKGGYILMDPTDENTKELLPSYLSDKSYLVARPEGETLRTSPVAPSSENMMRIVSRGHLAENGVLRMRSDLAFDGINDNVYRSFFSRIKPHERRRFFERVLRRAFPGATITRLDLYPDDPRDVAVPLSATIEFEAPDFPVVSGSLALLPLPLLSQHIGYVNFVLETTGLKERRFPLFSQIACGVEETFEVELSDAFPAESVSLPSFTFRPVNGVSATARVERRGRVLHGHTAFTLDRVEYSPAEYGGLRQALADVERMLRKRIALTPSPWDAVGAGARILHDRTIVRIIDTSDWVTLREARQEILSYEGIKEFSEHKIEFSPDWQTLNIIGAKVIAPDGTAQTVRPEQINFMDVPWVASAPRYPRRRTAVISMPGVKVGSVIEYAYELRTRGLPFFSISEAFSGFEPKRSKELIVIVPERLRALAQTTRPCWPCPGRDPMLDSEALVRMREERADGQVAMYWAVTNMPAVARENALPPWFYANDVAFFSLGNWAAYGQRVGESLLRASDVSDLATEQTQRLIAGADTAAARIVAIRDFVATTIRSVGPAFTELPLTYIGSADRTLHDGYGNSTDTAVLLHAMLTAAGLRPEFVLASTWSYKALDLNRPYVEIPQRDLFDRVLVRVTVDGQTLFLNDTDQYAHLGTTPSDGRLIMTLDGHIEPLTVPLAKADIEETEWLVRLQPDASALVEHTSRYAGTNFGVFRRQYAEMTPEKRRRHLFELISTISQEAELRGAFTTDYGGYPGHRHFSVTVPHFGVRDGDRLYFQLPIEAGNLLRIETDDRENPWFHAEPLRRFLRCRIMLPKGVSSIEMLPSSRVWTIPGNLGEVALYSFVPSDMSYIDVRWIVHLRSGVVNPADYPRIVEFIRDVSSPRHGAITLRF